MSGSVKSGPFRDAVTSWPGRPTMQGTPRGTGHLSTQRQGHGSGRRRALSSDQWHTNVAWQPGGGMPFPPFLTLSYLPPLSPASLGMTAIAGLMLSSVTTGQPAKRALFLTRAHSPSRLAHLRTAPGHGLSGGQASDSATIKPGRAGRAGQDGACELVPLQAKRAGVMLSRHGAFPLSPLADSASSPCSRLFLRKDPACLAPPRVREKFSLSPNCRLTRR
jgi:hypothetical protein